MNEKEKTIVRSNCFIQSIKYKFKHPEFKFVFRFYDIFHFHLYLESEDKIVDFKACDKHISLKEVHWWKRIIYRGYLRFVDKNKVKEVIKGDVL